MRNPRPCHVPYMYLRYCDCYLHYTSTPGASRLPLPACVTLCPVALKHSSPVLPSPPPEHSTPRHSTPTPTPTHTPTPQHMHPRPPTRQTIPQTKRIYYVSRPPTTTTATTPTACPLLFHAVPAYPTEVSYTQTRPCPIPASPKAKSLPSPSPYSHS